MSVDIEVEVVIARPRDEVAAFMFDPNNDLIWTNGVVEVKPRQPGRLAKGAEVERVSKFLGRRLHYVIEVLEAEGDEFVEMLTTSPFEMRVRYQLDDHADGTRARIRARGGGTGFYKMAAPLLSRMVRRAIQGDLDTLKEYLDAGADRAEED